MYLPPLTSRPEHDTLNARLAHLVCVCAHIPTAHTTDSSCSSFRRTMTDYDPPYTTPEEDPFNVVPARIQPRRKRSSMLDKWINEQQRTHSIRGRNILDLTDDRTPSPAPHADAYLPYPGPAGHLAPHAASRVTVDSYDMVEDEDIVNELASLRVSSDCEVRLWRAHNVARSSHATPI